MRHDHDTNAACAETPRVLPHEALAVGLVRVLDDNVEHLGEVLAETVGSCGLDTTTRCGNETLDGRCVQSTRELLLLRLDTGDDGHGEEVLKDAAVEVKNVEYLLVGLLLGEECGVALLPEELARAQERLRVLELPAHDRVPLVKLKREVTVALNPLGVVGVHRSLGCRADGDGLLEFGLACAGNPGDFRRKALDVVLLALENLLGDKHGEVGVLDTEFLDLAVEPFCEDQISRLREMECAGTTHLGWPPRSNTTTA